MKFVLKVATKMSCQLLIYDKGKAELFLLMFCENFQNLHNEVVYFTSLFFLPRRIESRDTSLPLYLVTTFSYISYPKMNTF
jgi:hypothetical protein